MKVSVKEAKSQVEQAVRTYLAKDENGQYLIPAVGRLPIYLLGLPGIGKTELLKEIADEMNIGYVSFSLTHHTRNSLLGLPVIRELPDGRKYTEFTMSEVIAEVEKKRQQGHTEGILMLDEFNCVSETVLPTMLAFLQTKNIGEFTLPDGWLITMAGNPTEVNRSARALDTALTDRVRMLELEFSPKDFLEYAREHNFHPAVLEYLTRTPADCYVLSLNKGAPETVTARGWENLSRVLYVQDQLDIPPSPEFVCQFIKSDRIVYHFMDCLAITKAGCTEDEMQTVITGGTPTEDFAERLRNLSDPMLWLVTEYFYRDLIGRTDKESNVRKAFQNIFSFLHQLDRPVIMERLFGMINRDPQLIKVLAKNNPVYRELCREFLKPEDVA